MVQKAATQKWTRPLKDAATQKWTCLPPSLWGPGPELVRGDSNMSTTYNGTPQLKHGSGGPKDAATQAWTRRPPRLAEVRRDSRMATAVTRWGAESAQRRHAVRSPRAREFSISYLQRQGVYASLGRDVLANGYTRDVFGEDGVERMDDERTSRVVSDRLSQQSIRVELMDQEAAKS